MSKRLQQFNKRLSETFSQPDRIKAHEQAGVILQEMAADSGVLHDIICQGVEAPDFFKLKRINPVIAFKVGEDRAYHLIAHLWLPLDNGASDLTHQSVHHHGSLLLSSVSAWGPGYESVLFKPGFRVVSDQGEDAGLTEMQIDKIYKNPKGHLEFLGPRTPHVVFFPSSFTVTYALWSDERERSSSWLKRLPGVQKYKKFIKSHLQRAGLASQLGLNVVENLDFFPSNGRLIRMKERVNYPAGSSENFYQNLFHSLQEMNFDRVDVIARRMASHPDAESTPAYPWFRCWERGDEIPRKMEEIHLGISKIQFTKRELIECFR